MEPPAGRCRFFDLPEVRLHAVEAGPSDGPLVILLHGFPEFWYGWHHQIPVLAAAGYRVVAPDQRGYNRSDKPAAVRAYRLDRLAGDVAALIGACGRERAAVAGHDWGGLAAWWTALRHRERVERLAILNVPHPAVLRRHLLTSRAQRRKSWYIFYFQLPRRPERWLSRNDFAAASRALTATSRPGTFSAADLAAYREAWSHAGALSAMLAWYRAALRYPFWRLPDPRIHVPALLLWGERDRFLGSEMVAPSRDLCDDVAVGLHPGATHWLQHEEPEWVNARLLDFLDGG